MPEFYAEPMKDRKCCSVCQKTAKEKGKKVLLTCINCHAITYCGVECQSEDWERHEWNCVPVMVTEIPGKGRGLVAATDIEKGDLIFLDKPVIKLAVTAEGRPVDSGIMTLLKKQLESLPAEAKLQFYKLKTRDDLNAFFGRNEVLIRLFLSNGNKIYSNKELREGKEKYTSVLHLNIALLNHSCAPNTTQFSIEQKEQDGSEDLSVELRAIKKIHKGEEITTCYFNDVKKLGCIPRKRKTVIKADFAFDCKCPVCLGQVPGQEKIVKKLIDLHKKLGPTPSDWKREAGLWSRIVDLTMELNIGDPREKTKALRSLAAFSHLARDKVLVKKAMDKWREFAKEIKVEAIQLNIEAYEKDLAKWSSEFSSNKAPNKTEIDFFKMRLLKI